MTQESTERRFHLGLRAWFVIAVLGPVTVVGAGVLWAGGRLVESTVQEQLEEDVQLVARSIQMPLSRALEDGRGDQLYEALESAFRIRRVYGAAVYGPEGSVVARVGAFGPESASAEAVGRVAVEGRGGEYGEVGERRVYSYFVPLTNAGGRIQGMLQVTRRRSDIEGEVRGVRLRLAGILGGVWLFMGLLVVFTYQRVLGRPFEGLSSAMAEVERGARDQRVEERGPQEVAEIARSFNRMVAGVKRAEAKVAERRARELALENELRRAEKLAAIGRLAGGVAHELGTPLAVVDGMAQRLQRGVDGERRTGAIREIRAAVAQMSGIVQDLLTFGAAESGERQTTSAHAVVVGAVGAVREEARKAGVELELETAPRDLAVRGDRLRLEGALTHLVRNAVQAAGPGGTVRIAAEGDAAGVRFVVEDSGPGLADGVVDRVFEPFFTTKAVGQGSGLGLAVAHAVAEEHGGAIEVDRSTLGGAKFVLIVRGQGDDD